MGRPTAGVILQAAVCLLCAVVGWSFTGPIWSSEFSGGSVTGPLLRSQDLSCYLFVIACVGTFFVPRLAAMVGVLATGLTLPLYLYFIVPGPFQRWTGGVYSVPASRTFVWNTLALPIALLLLATAISGVRIVTTKRE